MIIKFKNLSRYNDRAVKLYPDKFKLKIIETPLDSK